MPTALPNWQFKPGAGASQAEGAPAEGLHLAIGELQDRAGHAELHQSADRADHQGRAGRGDGPGPVPGGTARHFSKATVNGVPLSLAVSMSERKADGRDLAFALQVLSGKLDFKGRISALAASAELKGHLAVTTGVLTDFIAAVVRAGGQAAPTFDASVVGRFTFDGGIELRTHAACRQRLQDDDGRARRRRARWPSEQSATPSLKGRVALPKIDLEKWLALLAEQGRSAGPPGPCGKAPAPAKPASLSPFPAALDVSLALDVAEVVYRTGNSARPRGGGGDPQGRDHRAAAQGRAAGRHARAGGGRRPNSDAPAASRDRGCAETLAWLEVDPPACPSDKLQRLDLKAQDRRDRRQRARSPTVVAELDGQRATGSGSVTFATPLAVAATLQADRFDLDGYLPAEPAAGAERAARRRWSATQRRQPPPLRPAA